MSDGEAGGGVVAVNGRVVAAEAAAVGGIALAVRLPGLAHEPWGDELYHILAAREYLATGVFGINGGLYERSPVYSEMVAGLYRIFGVSPVVARLPALVAGVLTIVVLFAWVRRGGDRLAAWIAAAILVVTPDLIEQAQYARFYPLHHLFVLLAAIFLVELIGNRRSDVRRGVLLAGGAVVCLLIALQFQMLTVIAAAGMAAGAAVLAGPAAVAAIPRGRRAVVAGAALALVAAVAWLTVEHPFVQRALTLTSYADLWAEGNRDEVRFYHWLLLDDFPTVWTLSPVLAVLAIARRPRMAIMAVAVFGIGFLAHSLLAWKAARYISYTLPFFALIAGLGLAAAVPLVRRGLEQVFPGDGRGGRAARRAAWVAIAAFVVLTNSAFVETVRLVTRDNSLLYPGGVTPTLSWALAQPTLAPLAATADVVVSTEDLEAIWFFDRVDYVLDRDHLVQGGEKPEFAMDGKIMARMIGETESVRRVVACHPTGVLIAMRWALDSYKMSPETAEFIRETLEPVELPPQSGLVAFKWDHSAGVDAGACPGLPETAAEPA